MDPRPLVRVATAGSVDDGKSTFLGRLLFDCQAILDDQYEAIERASRQSGEADVNLALLTDGLRAEREQKITIDVAYRSFATPKRRFLMADTPGHEQYTRNMFTGASTADIAILMIDAERGPTSQTRRHAFITSLLRVPHVIVAVNKMDLVGYGEDRFEEHVESLREFISRLEFGDIRFVPISALHGDGVARCGDRMPWYRGPSILEFLEDVELTSRQTPVDMRFCVQCVVRPDRTLRALAGQVGSGTIRVGDEVTVFPSGQTSVVSRLLAPEGPLEEAGAGQPIMVELSDDLDVGRGDILARTKNPATEARAFEATLCWMSDQPASTTKPFRLLRGTRDTRCRVEEIVYRIDPQTLHREAPADLTRNDIGRVRVQTFEPEGLDLYERNRATGSFMLVDPETNEVAAAGLVTRILTESVDPGDSQGIVVWLTGLSGAGKSTIAEATALELRRRGHGVVVLDGDRLRAGPNRDLGFSENDRTENIRRTAEIARLLVEQGQIVICSLISPLRSQRALAREVVGDRFCEVYVSCSLDTAEARDPKGLYAKARRGDIPEFTGVSAPYDVPETPEIVLDTELENETQSLNRLLNQVLEMSKA